MKRHLRASLVVNKSKRLPDGTYTNEPFFLTLIVAGNRYNEYKRMFREGYTIYVFGMFHSETWKKEDGTLVKELVVIAKEIQLLTKNLKQDTRFGREEYKAAIKDVEEMSAELYPTLSDFAEDEYPDDLEEDYDV